MAPTLLHAAAQGSVALNPLNFGQGADGEYGEGAAPVITYEAYGHDEDIDRMVEVSYDQLVAMRIGLVSEMLTRTHSLQHSFEHSPHFNNHFNKSLEPRLLNTEH